MKNIRSFPNVDAYIIAHPKHDWFWHGTGWGAQQYMKIYGSIDSLKASYGKALSQCLDKDSNTEMPEIVRVDFLRGEVDQKEKLACAKRALKRRYKYQVKYPFSQDDENQIKNLEGIIEDLERSGV